MKNILHTLITIFATNFMFAQITLEHSFSNGVEAYITPTETFYYSTGELNQVKIYNSDYTLRNQFTLPEPMQIEVSKYTLSKNIFNSDNLLEIIVTNYNDNSIKIYNENGLLVKDFGTGYFFGDYESFNVFHDYTSGNNKLTILKTDFSTEVYNLGTNSLTTKEIENKTRLLAFPNPTNKTLTIINPQNGTNKIQIFDSNGKLVINNFFSNSVNKIDIDVENLPKGTYIYKIGKLSSKFIKN